MKSGARKVNRTIRGKIRGKYVDAEGARTRQAKRTKMIKRAS